jgi:hypothetical protein
VKIYVAMICDRHSDPEPYLFTTAQAAIDFARDQALDNALDAEDFDESETPDGWLYYASYSEEGDNVWVLEKEIEETPC